MRKISVDWVITIIALIVFWPVGLYLLSRVMSQDRSAAVKGSSSPGVLGYILLGIGAIGMFSLFTSGESIKGENEGTLLVCIMFVVGGMLVVVRAGRYKRDAKKYRRYIDIVVNHNQSSIDGIAAAVGVPYETARDNLQQMIDKRFFPGAYIHEGNRQLVRQVQQPAAAGAPAYSGAFVKACSGCGANNTVWPGRANECEYCGSPL
jgi:hypothetical protein